MANSPPSQSEPFADNAPTLEKERSLWVSGCSVVAGVDEAGRGALAGPVVAAAVVVPTNASLSGIWSRVRDSKLLTAHQRESYEAGIQEEAHAWAVGQASAPEIDTIGIAPATRLAMIRAIEALSVRPGHLLIDWVRLAQVNIPQTSWPKADRSSVSVAAASILAKVYRDRLLCRLAESHQAYGFAEHKGYGTAAHREALRRYGPCVEHRYSFSPIKQSRTLFDSI